MKKNIAAGLGVTAVTAFVSLVGVSAAHADDYVDNTNPSGTEARSAAVPANQGAGSASTGAASAGASTAPKSGLPNTGGPDAGLLAGGAALVLAGGASVLVVRRRRAA